MTWLIHTCAMTHAHVWYDESMNRHTSARLVVTHAHESYHTCEWVTSRMWMRHVTQVNASYHAYTTDTPAHDAMPKNQLYALSEWVMSHEYNRHTSARRNSQEPIVCLENAGAVLPLTYLWCQQQRPASDWPCPTWGNQTIPQGVCEFIYIYIHMNIFTYIYVQCVCVCVCAYVHSKKGLCWVRVVSQEAKTQNESCHRYEWVMFYIWMSRVTHMNESCSSYEWIMSDIWMSRVTDMNESCHRYEWVMSQIWMSHVTHVNEPWHTREWVTWNIRMSHVMHMNNFIDAFSCVSWLIHMCDVTHSYLWYDPFICVTRLIHMNNRCHSINQSCQTYGWLMSHIWTSHVTHMNEPCYTYE